MKLIILDRDGVINKESAAYIRTPAEWHPIAGSMQAIADLTAAGYTITVATNQSGIGRGYYTLQTLKDIHNKMLQAITDAGGKIAKIYFCPHTPDDACNCRKPKDGMFREMEHDFHIDLKQIRPIFIGDSMRDVELGLANNCQFYLTTSADSHGGETLKNITPQLLQQISVVKDLAEATTRILG